MAASLLLPAGPGAAGKSGCGCEGGKEWGFHPHPSLGLSLWTEGSQFTRDTFVRSVGSPFTCSP